MIYIVSGVSRSGKTKVAKELLEQHKLPYLSTDAVMMAFMHGVKEVDLHDKMWPSELAEKLWGFLKHFIVTLIHSEEDYVLEGEAFLPSKIAELLLDYPEDIKVVFMGYDSVDIKAKVKDCKNYSTSDHDWLLQEDDAFIETHIRNMVGYSKELKDLCKKYNLPYFDQKDDFLGNIKRVQDFLINSRSR